MAQQCPHCGHMTVMNGQCMHCNRPVGQPTPAAANQVGPQPARPGDSSGAAVAWPDGRRVDLRPGVRATIGRANCDVNLGDPATPAEAAVLIPQPDGRYTLRNTSGAVIVDGNFVTNDVTLDDGARIQIGRQTLRFIAPTATLPGHLPGPAAGSSPAGALVPASPNQSANRPQSILRRFINPNPTGGPLIPVGTTLPAAPPPPATPPQTIHTQPGQTIQMPQQPSKFPLRNWQGQRDGLPYYEGVVDNIDGPHNAHSQPALWKQVTAAMLLGKISPWLGMSGYMMGKKDYHVWTCRLRLDPAYQAANNGSPAAMIFVLNNQPQVGFQLGDMIAVWGKPDKDGNLVMERVYVYDTNAWVRVKK